MFHHHVPVPVPGYYFVKTKMKISIFFVIKHNVDGKEGRPLQNKNASGRHLVAFV
jgi:hypothetical protein